MLILLYQSPHQVSLAYGKSFFVTHFLTIALRGFHVPVGLGGWDVGLARCLVALGNENLFEVRLRPARNNHVNTQPWKVTLVHLAES